MITNFKIRSCHKMNDHIIKSDGNVETIDPEKIIKFPYKVRCTKNRQKKH